MTNLNDEQQRAVNAVYGPVLVLAGPGSGKTHTLTERIRHMIEDVRINDNEILVITFSKKAAVEMKERFDKLTRNKSYRVYFGTFHAVFYNILKNNSAFEKISILNEKTKIKLLKKVIAGLKIPVKDDAVLVEMLEEISEYKNADDKEAYLSLKFEKEKREEFEKVYEKYVIICKNENSIDFDDMLYMCRDLLKAHAEIRIKYQKMYKYILVDEFQDINKVQYEVLEYLAGKNRNVFAVGDDDQSIYGFRGSKPELMKEFMNQDGCKVINLCCNYRSSEKIVDISHKLIRNNKSRIEKKQIAIKESQNDGLVTIENCNNAISEAEYVIDKIKKIKDENTNLSNVAVIYRTIRCVEILKEKMDMEGILYTSNAITDSFYDIDWVKDIITYLRLAVGEHSLDNLSRIINRPERDLDRDAILLNDLRYDKYEKMLSDIDRISNMSSYAAVNYIMKGMGYERYLFEKLSKKGYSIERIKDSVFLLLDKSKIYENISEWLYHIDCVSESTLYEDGVEDKVNMLTAHASKGLEFDTVFVIGLQEGIFPHNKSSMNEDIEEERRLLYVALTRAKRNLYIIGRGEYKHGKKISRFINELIQCQ